MVKLFYITHISLDLAHCEIFCVKYDILWQGWYNYISPRYFSPWLSVGLSMSVRHKSCSRISFETLRDTFTKFSENIRHYQTMCREQVP